MGFCDGLVVWLVRVVGLWLLKMNAGVVYVWKKEERWVSFEDQMRGI